MSDWGEEPGIEAGPFDVDDEPREEREPGRAFGVDIAELTAELVDASLTKAVRKQVAAVVSESVDDAVAAALDEDVIEDLRIRAQTAAAAAVAQHLDVLNDDQSEDEPELYYGSVDEFVREYLISAYRRRIDGQHRVWAAKWWEYDEAVIRLEALWRAWEKLRQDASTGMSVWWRDHADHHMSVLMDKNGPFAAAAEIDENRSRKGEPLPYTAPPADLFPDVRVPVDDLA